MDAITVVEVKAWYKTLLVDRPTMRMHTYGLLRTILNTAFQDDLIVANPCRIRGAGTVKRATSTDVPTAVEIHEMADEMGVVNKGTKDKPHYVPLAGGKYKVMTLVAAWCGLRFGETTELRRKDLVYLAEPDPTSTGEVPVSIKVRREWCVLVASSSWGHLVDAGLRSCGDPTSYP